MAKKVIIKRGSFLGGELSPDLDARSDIEFYDEGCKELTNAIVWQQGGITKRPGTKHVHSAGVTPDTPTFSGSGTVASGSEHWTGNFTECEGECLYTLDGGYGPYNIQTSIDGGSNWTTQETITATGTFTWKCKPHVCDTSKIRIMDFEGNSSAITDAAKQCASCAGVTLDTLPDDMDCSEVAYITLVGADVCCPYTMTAFSDGGTIEEGLEKTGQQTWTYTVPDPIGSECCLDDYVLLELFCCAGSVLDDKTIDLGYPVPPLWSGDNPETMEADSTQEIVITLGRGNSWSWFSLDEPDFTWQYAVTVDPVNTLISAAGLDDGTTGDFNVFDECGSNVLGEIEIGAAFYYDTENSVSQLARNSSGLVYWVGGNPVPWFFGTIVGEGFGWNAAGTQKTKLLGAAQQMRVYANNSACGSCTVTIEDGDNVEVEGTILCTSGDWYEIGDENTCVMPGPSEENHLDNAHYKSVSYTVGNKRQTSSLYNVWVWDVPGYGNSEVDCEALKILDNPAWDPCETVMTPNSSPCQAASWQWCICQTTNMATGYDGWWQYTSETTTYYEFGCPP